jgi:hypothetical protein
VEVAPAKWTRRVLTSIRTERKGARGTPCRRSRSRGRGSPRPGRAETPSSSNSLASARDRSPPAAECPTQCSARPRSQGALARHGCAGSPTSGSLRPGGRPRDGPRPSWSGARYVGGMSSGAQQACGARRGSSRDEQERSPAHPRQNPAGSSEKGSVVKGEIRPCYLASEHLQQVAEHHDLDLLGILGAKRQDDDIKESAHAQ